MIDYCLPVAASETTPEFARTHYVYPDAMIAQPAGSQIRVVRNVQSQFQSPFSFPYDPATFVQKHHRDMCVVTVENTSVNHYVAQARSLHGASIDGGRTILEAMAMAHGQGLLLPNANMGGAAYLSPGEREDVPASARAEVISDARTFSLSTHGYAGLPNAPASADVAQARSVRERLEDASPFGKRYAASALRTRYLEQRRVGQAALESNDLIRKLLLVRSLPTGNPARPTAALSDYGLALDVEQDRQLTRLLEVFPSLETDNLQTEAALSFMLARYGLSCAVLMGPGDIPVFGAGGSIADTPLAFDFSHNNHTIAQNVMWSRLSMVMDGLITLLKETPHGSGSMWDRSLIYVATDFGRTKERPRDSYEGGTGHHLNNGNLFVSPMLKGNRVYGGVDPSTCLTYGFDPATGEPDRGRVMREGHLYSLAAQVMGIDFPGRHNMSGLIR